jgi:hypothetical protein
VDLGASPAVCDFAHSWDNAILFSG